MTMVVKYQLVAVRNPLEIIDIIMNHLDSLLNLTQNKFLKHLIETSKHQMLSLFKTHNCLKHLQLIRQILLNYFIQIRTRVSALLKNGQQEMNGDFILSRQFTIVCQCQAPGDIVHFDEANQTFQTHFNFGGECLIKDEKTSLGLNM